MIDKPTNALANPAVLGALKLAAKMPANASPPASKGPPVARPAPKEASGSGRSSEHNRSPQFQKANPNVAKSGVPRPTGRGERQLDGNRTATVDAPQKGKGLAERQPAPTSTRSERRSGLEDAMSAEADRLHPRRAPKSTTRK